MEKFILLLTLSFVISGEEIGIMEYNVQNLVDDKIQGTEYSNTKVTKKQYDDKVRNIASIVSGAILTHKIEIICFIEIENEDVLNALSDEIFKISGKRFLYQYIDKNSKLATNQAVLSSYPIKTKLHSVRQGRESSRDILEVNIDFEKNNSLTMLINHWKSKARNNGYNGLSKRLLSAKSINYISEDILNKNQNSQILLLGDFNTSVYDNDAIVISNNFTGYGLNVNSNKDMVLDKPGLWYYPNFKKDQGSYYFNNNWEMIDYFYLNKNLVDDEKLTYSDFLVYKPNQIMKKDNPFSFNGQSGYSDHLPIILKLKY